jgi:hypothetical protein
MKEQLAINGGPKTLTKAFNWPVFDHSDVEAVSEVTNSGAWGVIIFSFNYQLLTKSSSNLNFTDLLILVLK